MPERSDRYRSIRSRASLASLSATSSVTRNSSREQALDSSFARVKCVSSVPVTRTARHQLIQNSNRKERLSLAHRTNSGPPPAFEPNVKLRSQSFLVFVVLHLSRVAAQVFQQIYPELFYLIFMLRATLVRYQDEYLNCDTFPSLSFTSFYYFPFI